MWQSRGGARLFQAHDRALSGATMSRTAIVVFLMSYVPGISAEAIGEEARAWRRQRANPLAHEITEHANDRTPERRLRIGYVSPDFRDHPAASFVLPLLEHHDRTGTRSYAIRACVVLTPSPNALEPLADGLARRCIRRRHRGRRACYAKTALTCSFDLAMHSGGGRPRLFARKPAPVQICWLAYVGTTGLTTMDYRITDPHLDPPGLDVGWCTEAPLELPDTFWCYRPLEPSPNVGALPALTSGYVTFGSQHSFHKIHRVSSSLGACPSIGCWLALVVIRPA